MARQEIGKVQELMMISPQEQEQEATGEGDSSESQDLPAQQQASVSWNPLP